MRGRAQASEGCFAHTHTHTQRVERPTQHCFITLHAQVSVLIVGAGPTGLGAATRLQQHGRTDWLLIDQVRCCVEDTMHARRGASCVSSI